VQKGISGKVKAKSKGLRSLIRKLDIVFSKYIRLSNSNSKGWVRCFTCGDLYFWKDIDCGHYITRDNKNTRWDERNCQPQCQSENRFRDGAKDVFALKLQIKYGKDILEKLNEKKNQIKKFTKEELEELFSLYKSKVEELEK
jgi:hypothetical protein